jgi:hypothetical protein
MANIKIPFNGTLWSIKDQYKADVCTKFIGRGSSKSSTNMYRSIFAELSLSNSSTYDENDIVFISVEGDRKCRFPFSKIEDEVRLALNANVTVVCDNSYNRNRSYNIGERELNTFLLNFGYVEILNNEHFSAFKMGNVNEKSNN